MRINLYEDANGELHFRDIEVDWIEETPTGKLSKRLLATGIMFAKPPPTMKTAGIGRPTTICDQSGGRYFDHRQRWRDASYRCRADDATGTRTFWHGGKLCPVPMN
jgi:hypothetical protein